MHFPFTLPEEVGLVKVFRAQTTMLAVGFVRWDPGQFHPAEELLGKHLCSGAPC